MRKLIIVCALFVIGCQQVPQGNTLSLSGIEFSALTGGNLEIANNTVSGVGSIVAGLPLQEIRSDFQYAFNMTLSRNSSVKLVANANKELQNGVSLEFAESGGIFQVNVRTPSGSNDESAKFASIDPLASYAVEIDVHNGETPAHVIIKFDDREMVNRMSSGFGQGNRWGFEVNGAAISNIAIREAEED